MIPLPTPVTVPARQFDGALIANLNITASSPTTGEILISLRPINLSTGELAPKEFTKQVATDELFEAIENVPEMAFAYQAVLSAVQPTIDWLNSRNL